MGARVARVAFGAAVAACLSAVAILATYSVYQQDRADTARRARLTDVVAASLASAAVENDAERAREWLGVFAHDPGILAAGVTRADGTLLASWGEAALLERGAEDSGEPALERPASRTWTTLGGGRANAGELEVVVLDAGAEGLVAALRAAAVAALVAAAFAGSLGVFFAHMAARPFAATIEALRRRDEPGAPEEPLAETGAAELREMIARLNALMAEAHAREAEIAELGEELKDARALADASNAAKTRFLAHMSHELRTPLNAILGYTKFVHEDLEGDEHAQSRDDLERVKRAGEHLLDLINQVLDLSKVEAGGVELELSGFDAGALMRQVVETSEPLAAKNETVLELHECPNGEVIVSDSLRLRQCLLNVLGNALKFTHQGRVDVRAWVAKNAGERIFTCEIKDTGPGIPEDKIAAIFEPFVQVDDDRAPATKGTGLGLAITKRLCAAMGGDVACASEVGRGSTFTVTVRDGASLDEQEAA